MDHATVENYIQAIGNGIREFALDAKEEFVAARGSPEEKFKAGYLMAFHRVLSYMQQEAELVFQVPLEKIGLAAFDAEKDLLVSNDE